MPKPAPPTISPITLAERERIAAILSLPTAKADRAAAERLAFGSDATPAEASAALLRAQDGKKAARETSLESMRRAAGLPTAKLRPGEIAGLRHAAKTGRPAERDEARKRLAAAGEKP